jgi:hypothetical protein
MVESGYALLARISHQLSTTAADPGMFTVLCSLGLLDVLSSIHARLSDSDSGTQESKWRGRRDVRSEPRP